MNTCAFCGEIIEPNFYNACEDCYEKAKDDPEKFLEEI